MDERFEMIIQPEASAGIYSGFDFILQDSPEEAAKWLTNMRAAIASLEYMPRRFPLAPEDRFFAEEIRQLFYGRRAGIYRVLFTIAGDTVSVLHVRHDAQDTLKPSDTTR